ncbi:hypothetical protein [Herpetosiphon gulosus]|uniref:PIN domain-containing protein n=1 Tax=Herpetosiphon gulosus TaxID=1973496 RepID=A0ABP9X8A0_9CHLR
MRFYDRLRWKLGWPSMPIIDASLVMSVVDNCASTMISNDLFAANRLWK